MDKISKVNSYIYISSSVHPLSNSEEFEALKVDVIINCAGEIDNVNSDNYIIDKIPFEHDIYASMLDYIDEGVDKINNYLKQKKRILLYCDTGNSRAPAILIYYLMQYKKFSFDKALSLLKQIRPSIELHDNFERELRTIEED